MALNYPGSIISSTQRTANNTVATGRWSLIEHMQNLRVGTWPLTLVREPNFYLNSLLIHADGINGANNTVFAESSSSSTVTTNGRPGQGTFSPFSQTGWSTYFNGSTDYLTAGGSIVLGGDFTVEAWIYPLTYGTNGYYVYGLGNDANSTGATFFIVPTTGYMRVYSGNSNLLSGTATAVTLNAWNHIAWVRSSNTIRAYINGVQVDSAASSSTFSGTSYINAELNGATTYPGGGTYYLSNLRVTNSAIYTGAFTPPTSPLSPVAATALLTSQSNRSVDNSTNNYAITRAGTPSIQPLSPFAPPLGWSAGTYGGSGLFNGSTDYLTFAANNTRYDITSGDFTVECWVYRTAGGAEQYLFSNRSNSPSSGWEWRINATNLMQFFFTGGSSLTSTGTIPVNAWTHLVASRQTNTFRFFINGVLDSSTTFSNGTSTSGIGLAIGYTTTAPGGYYTGYMSDARIVKGTAVYTGTFTLPTAPLTAVANTTMLLNFTNAGIYDMTAKNDIITYGTAAISTAQSKFGGSSINLNGSSYAEVPSSVFFDLGTTYTIEFWLYPNSLGTNWGGILHRGFYSTGVNTWDNFAFSIRGLNSGLRCYFYATTNANEQYIDTGAVFSTGQWYHIAMVRNGTTGYVFINGAQNNTIAGLNTPAASTRTLKIGVWDYSAGSEYLNGYIDDIRITKGLARYTGAFTAPTAPFADG